MWLITMYGYVDNHEDMSYLGYVVNNHVQCMDVTDYGKVLSANFCGFALIFAKKCHVILR